MRDAALLSREHGYSGTAFSDVIAHSGARRGSICTARQIPPNVVVADELARAIETARAR